MPAAAATVTANFSCGTPGGPGTGTKADPFILNQVIGVGYGYEKHAATGELEYPKGWNDMV